MQALLLLKATFATWEQKAKILFQLKFIFSLSPFKKNTYTKEHTDRQVDRQKGRQTDTWASKAKGN